MKFKKKTIDNNRALCALLHICSHFFTVITVPKTFYFPSWTVSERWSHSEPTVSAFWANGERTLIGIRWTLMNDERLVNVERKRSAEWTVNAPANSFTLQKWVSSDLQFLTGESVSFTKTCTICIFIQWLLPT